MKIAGVNKESIVDGPGMRVTIFISGCFHNCPGCHNQEAQSFQYGEDLTEAIKNDILDAIGNPMVTGVTYSGGDPMYSAKDLVNLTIKIKSRYPKMNFWLYTGFTWEEIFNEGNIWMTTLLQYMDVIVDGRFVEELKDYSQSFRGSTNQRFIDVKKSLSSGKIVEWEEEE